MLVAFLAALLYAVPAQAQQTRVYTLYWTHDGANTESYAQVVDGVRTTICTVSACTCTGSGAARQCSAPITLTFGVEHSVSVVAVGLFGEAESVPFPARPPGTAVGVSVGRPVQ